jgi:hypothetical protein
MYTCMHICMHRCRKPLPLQIIQADLQASCCVVGFAACRNPEGIAEALLEVHRAKGVPFRSNMAGWNPLILAVMNFA